MALLSDSWKVDALAVFVGILTIIYWLVRRRYTYWERKGFKYLPGVSYLFGHFNRAFLQKETFAETVERVYHSSDEPFIGIYSVFRPILLFRDPELIRGILIKDFSYFTDRGIHCNEDYDPLSVNLVGLPGQRWRDLRARLSPTFTSGKLKAMFSTLVECGSSLQEYLQELSDNDKLLDVCEIAACHATNVTASVAFGIEVDTIKDPNNDFRKYGRQILETTIENAFRRLMYFIAPELMSVLRVKCVNPGIENFIISVVKQNLEYREKNNVHRKDFFQLLIQLRNTGNVQLDDEWETVIKTNESQKAMSLLELAAQAIVFFGAGNETSATTLTFVMHELANNPDIQQRVHDEIDQVLERNDGQVTYDSISEMKYLEACIDETLRKYSIAPMLSRTCVNDYQIPGTDKIVEKGTEVFVPIYALQRDEKYWPDPDKYDPERFNDKNSAGKDQINRPYYPFGDGPRNCIGLRMGKMQTKTGIVMMLHKFRFEYEEKMKNRKMKFDPKAFLLAPLGGLHLRVIKR